MKSCLLSSSFKSCSLFLLVFGSWGRLRIQNREHRKRFNTSALRSKFIGMRRVDTNVKFQSNSCGYLQIPAVIMHTKPRSMPLCYLNVEFWQLHLFLAISRTFRHLVQLISLCVYGPGVNRQVFKRIQQLFTIRQYVNLTVNQITNGNMGNKEEQGRRYKKYTSSFKRLVVETANTGRLEGITQYRDEDVSSYHYRRLDQEHTRERKPFPGRQATRRQPTTRKSNRSSCLTNDRSRGGRYTNSSATD